MKWRMTGFNRCYLILGKPRILFIFLWVVLLLWAQPLWAAEQHRPVFGPEEFVNSPGGTATFERLFTLPASTTAPFTLCLLNGEPEEKGSRSERCPFREMRRHDKDDEDEGDDERERDGKKDKHRDRAAVTSGRVLVDGREVVSARDFPKREDVLERHLRLTPGPHRLTVELRGPPGSHVTLAIVGLIRLGRLAQARAGHTATLLSDGTVLLTGGRGKHKNILDSAEIFEPKLLKSRLLPEELTAHRTEHTATLGPTAEVVLAAGQDAHGVLFSAELFQRDGTFHGLAATVQVPRAGHTATLLPDGRVLILGGRDVSHLGLDQGESFEVPSGLLYDPRSGRFTLVPHALQVARHDHTATLLPDGRVLIVGGRHEAEILSSAEVFDPAIGESHLLDAHLHTARLQHTASLLNDGRVLIAGGRSRKGKALDSVELFDPSTQTFSRLPSTLREGRFNHTATVWPTGEIFLAGGREDEDKDPTKDTELHFQPGRDADRPTVLEIHPAPDATGISQTPLIGIRFSEPINVTTLPAMTLTLVGPGGPVAGTVSPGEEGLLAFFVPAAPLASGTTYTLTLEGLTDRAGNRLATVTSRFTTVVPSPTISGFAPTNGPVGILVTLTGTNFVTVSSVAFNGVATSTFTVTSETSLTAVVPPGATTGPITVTTPGGTATSATNFTVLTGPTITGFTPTSGPVGTAVTISGLNFDAVAANNQAKFNEKPAIIASAMTTSITTTVPQGATTGAITVTTARGTGASAQAFTVTVQDFALSALPTPLLLPASGQGSLAVTLTGTGGYSSLVKLAVTGVPSGASATFSTTMLTAGQSAFLRVATNGTTPTGTYPLTVTATGLVGGAQTTRTATVNVQVLGTDITTFAGQVLDEEENPVKGAIVRMGTVETTTDDGGNFLMQNPPVGPDQLFLIDGGPASTPGRNLPIIPYKGTIVAGQANVLGFVPKLHFQKTTGLVDISNTSIQRVVTDPEIPGFQMTIPAGATIIGWDGQPNTRVSIRRVPIDRMPLPPPPSGGVPGAVYMDYFGKPGGGTPSEPIPVTLPNDMDLPPGTQVELWYFDEAPDGSRPNQWAKYGTGTVSPDGSQVVPDIDPATGKPFGQPRFCCGANLARLLQGIFDSVFTTASTGPDQEQGGDPVDLATGLFTMQKTDVVLPGRMPIALTRTFRTQAVAPGPFGRGTAHPYHILLGQQANQRIVRLPDGRRFAFTLQADGTYRNRTDAAVQGAVITEPSGVPTLRWKDGTVWTFGATSTLAINTFELTQMADRNGNTITLTRSGQLITAITSSDGRALTIEYEGGRIVRVHDPIGRTVSYAYDTAGRLVTVTDPEHGVTRYTYDSANRMTTITDPRGLVYLQNFYSPSGRVLRQVQADGSEWRFRYELTGATVTGPCTPMTGNVVTVTLPFVPCPTVDSLENLQAGFTITGGTITATTVVDPREQTATTRFNARGYATGRTDGLNQTITPQRTAANQVSASTDSLGRTTRYEYDANGNVTKITDPDNKVTQFVYEPTFNRVTKITDALNQITEFTYDATNGNLLTTKDPLNHVTTITYNTFGQPTSVQGPILSEPPTTFEYDTQGNLIRTTDPLGSITQRAYDAVSRLISLSDPRGLITQFRYDGLNRVTEIADPRHGLTRFTYDGNGSLLTLTDAKNQTTTYTYDSMDRLATRTDALNRQESYEYDPAGNLSQFTDRKNQESTFTYDSLNRRTGASYADGSSTSFTYDSLGRLARATDLISGIIEFSYDTLDRLANEITPQGVVTYAYDALGRRTSMAANGQTPVGYQYDAASRLTQVAQGTQVVGLGYDAAGRRTSLTYPNGTNTAYSYDNASRLTNITHTGPAGLIESLAYTYDAAGNRVSLTRTNGTATLLPAAVQAAYDAGNEQIQFNAASPNQAFDANGNLTTQTDASGTTTYTWDVRNRLVAISGPGLSASFSYDAMGRRVSKTINGVTAQYLHDKYDIVQEIGGVAVGASYVRSLKIDEPFARQTPSANESFHTDAIGSTLVLTNDAGASAVTYSYEPFGRTRVTGTSANPFQFTGRENDETGLYYYRARYYHAQFPRFLGEDPIGILGDLNLYSYVTNNPISFVDPYGLLFGIPLGEKYGDTATQYWADQYVQTGNTTYAVLGSLSSLWTHDTSTETALSLGGGYALVGWAARTGPWLGKIAYHAAHKSGPHQYPHLQIMIRTGKHMTKHFRIRLGGFFGILPFSGQLPQDEEFCQGGRKC